MLEDGYPAIRSVKRRVERLSYDVRCFVTTTLPNAILIIAFCSFILMLFMLSVVCDLFGRGKQIREAATAHLHSLLERADSSRQKVASIAGVSKEKLAALRKLSRLAK